MSRKTRLALEAMVDIGLHARPDPVQSRDVTERLGVPQRYLEQSLQHLVREGLLRGVRGPRGGYALARERRRISAGDVVRALGSAEVDDGAELPAESVTAGLWERAESAMLAELDAMTIEQLCAEAQAKRPAEDGHFAI